MTAERTAAQEIAYTGSVAKVLVIAAAAISGGLLVATLYRADSALPLQLPGQIGMGDTQLALSPQSPQWNALKMAKVGAARSMFGDAVPAHVRIDEAHASRIGSPLSGHVASLYVELGQRVKQGDALFSVSSADLTTLQSELSLASHAREVATENYRRTSAMVRERLMPAKEELAALAQKRQAELAEAATKAKLKALRVATTKANQFTVKAPRDGVIVEKNVLPSQQVSPGASLLQMYASDDRER